MLNEPRIYRHSPFRIGLLILVFGILGIVLFFTFSRTESLFLILFAGIFVLVFISVLYPMTMKTIISEDEIAVQTILGTKSLRWSEISQISGRGYSIKLRSSDSFNGNVTIAPSPQLPDYDEIVEWIGKKRPDLFSPLEYGELSRSWLNTITPPLVGLSFIGFGFFFFSQAENTFFPVVMMAVVGVIFIGIPLTSPQSVSIQGNSMVINYLLNQKTLLADEIESIDLRFTQTRNGKNYFVAMNLVNRKTIRISGLNPNLPVVFLVLRNWHKKFTPIGLTNRPN